MWWVPALIFVACFATGAIGAARWLPPFEPGLSNGLAFLLVCGLIAGALAAIGLDIFDLVKQLEFGGFGGVGGRLDAQTLANGLKAILFDAGMLLGLAGIVFVLATRRRGATDPSSF